MDDQTLITRQMVATLLEDCRKTGTNSLAQAVFAHEPAFREAVQQQLLGIAGRLVLSGAPAELARDIACDIDKLAVFAAAAMQGAYRGLLADLVPDTSGQKRTRRRRKRARGRGKQRAPIRARAFPRPDQGSGDEATNG